MNDHADAMSSSAHCRPTPDGKCGVCADDAELGRVQEVDVHAMLARVAIGARIETVALDLIDDVAAGDLVLVHQGFAIGRSAAGSEES